MLDQIDLDDHEAFRRGEHHEWFRYLRAHAPVWRKPDPDGDGAWVLCKHADIVAANRDAATFSSDLANSGILGTSRRDVQLLGRPPEHKQIVMMDPPEHAANRAIVQPVFARSKVAARFEARVREVAAQLLDAAMARDGLDFIEDIAVQLPLQVVGEAIGVPPDDRRELFEWVNVIGSPSDPAYCSGPEQYRQAGEAIAQYGRQMIAERQSCPRDDLMNIIAHAEIDGEPWTEARKVAHFRLFWNAGSETTRAALAHGLLAFIRNPEAYELLRADPSLLEGPAVEEILRWASPVMYFRRTAIRDVVVRGQQIRAGDHVLLWYVSGNRDEDVFTDPFRFDITRSPNPHLAFGGGGPHFCLGAYLARLELRVLFELIAERVPAPALMGEPDFGRGNFFNVIRALPVRLSGASLTRSPSVRTA